jgi:N6-adenosine-specific RNA methylase IME4
MRFKVEIIRQWAMPNKNTFDIKPIKKYNIIYADPPWEYKESGSGNRVIHSKYPTLNIEKIKSIPIDDIADDKCILFLWVTFPRLKQGLEVIEAWNFQYYGLGFDWVKMNPKSETPFWGMGYYTRQNTEICLIGVRKNKNNRIKPQVRNILSVIHSPKREHSRKPNEIRNNIVKICGDLPRIELFAREKTEGWDVWGNEVDSDINLKLQ